MMSQAFCFCGFDSVVPVGLRRSKLYRFALLHTGFVCADAKKVALKAACGEVNDSA
jgi:hypothetical protein